MSRVDNIKTAIDSANSEQLMQIAAIMGVQDETSEKVATATETVEIDPRLTKYAGMYERWSDADKKRIPWRFVQERLLAKGYLAKAEAMNEGGILFGIDEAGNPLVADGGVEPIMTGMEYAKTRKEVYGEQKTPTGYVMFPYTEPYKKSPEILAFEKFTGEPFVKSEDKQSWRSSWLDSGENRNNIGYVRVADFAPSVQRVGVYDGNARYGHRDRGVRRLLRVEA